MRFKQLYVPQQELSTDESLVGANARAVMTQYIPSPLMNHWSEQTRSVMTQYIPSPLMNHWSEQRQGQLWRNTYHLHWWIIGRSKGKVSYDVIHTNQKPQIWCTTLVVGWGGYRVYFAYLTGQWKEIWPGLCWRQRSHVVITANHLHKWYHIFCDNYFTYKCITNRLHRLNTFITGTLRANIVMPRLMHNVNIGEKESVFLWQGPLLGCAYKERRNRTVYNKKVSNFLLYTLRFKKRLFNFTLGLKKDSLYRDHYLVSPTRLSLMMVLIKRVSKTNSPLFCLLVVYI